MHRAYLRFAPLLTGVIGLSVSTPLLSQDTPKSSVITPTESGIAFSEEVPDLHLDVFCLKARTNPRYQ